MYESTTYDVILDRMLARVPDTLDKREGSVIWDTHSPTAIELQNLYIELDALINNGYGDTAAREFLILLCKDRGITPKPASNAVLQAHFTPTTISADALIGQRFNIDDLNYVVISAIDENAGTYRVQCETPGEIGNRHMGTMIPMEYIQGLETATLTEVLVPGENEEDTEVLRKRYFDSFGEFAFGGNRSDYLNKVHSIQGVGGVKLERVWNGNIRPAEMIPSESVQSWFNAQKSLPDDVNKWLTAVYTAALQKLLTVGGTVLITITNASDYGEASTSPGGLVDTVQQTLDPEENAGEGYGLAPIGHVVTVHSAEPVTIQIKTNISFNTGYSWADMKSTIQDAVSNYLLTLRKSWESNDYTVVRVAQLESTILALEGVVDIDGTTINGSTSNLTLTKYQIPTFGGCERMIRQVDLVSYLPPYLQNYKEQVAALAAEDPEFLLVWDAVNGILYNHFISTANEYGISRYEKILGIRPTEDDNLESRRSRVQVQWVNLIPYTIRTFIQKLKVLCGDTPYVVSGNFRKNYELSVITQLENVGQVDELNNLFQGILPMNLVINSRNEIPVNTDSCIFFSGRLTTHVDLILTHDWCGTLKADPAFSFVGYPSDTAKVQITHDFNEKSVISGDANAASGVTYTDVIKI